MSVQDHCDELNRCNQRGGRMLSILDLLEAYTLDLDLAAYLTARISRGDSFLVGARPGGAGKTTVMCALLNMIPTDRRLLPATSEVMAAIEQGRIKEKTCVICHEIGRGHYFAYQWGQELRRYCALRDLDCMLATNLHADDLDEAHDQICLQSRVPAEGFNAFALQIFLSVEGSTYRPRRIIDKIYASDGVSEHRLVFSGGGGPRFPSGPLPLQVDPDWFGRCRRFIQDALDADVRTIEATRERFMGFVA